MRFLKHLQQLCYNLFKIENKTSKFLKHFFHNLQRFFYFRESIIIYIIKIYTIFIIPINFIKTFIQLIMILVEYINTMSISRHLEVFEKSLYLEKTSNFSILTNCLTMLLEHFMGKNYILAMLMKMFL